MKLSKLHLACSTRKDMVNINHVYIDTDYLVATNQYILTAISNKELLNAITDLPCGIWIDSKDFIKLTKEFISGKYIESEKVIILTTAKGKKEAIQIYTDLDKYPNWKYVIPNNNQSIVIDSIKINTTYLSILSEAIGAEDNKLVMTFTGKDRAIICKPFIDNNFDGYAIIMPIL